jgi:hypothetical protein
MTRDQDERDDGGYLTENSDMRTGYDEDAHVENSQEGKPPRSEELDDTSQLVADEKTKQTEKQTQKESQAHLKHSPGCQVAHTLTKLHAECIAQTGDDETKMLVICDLAECGLFSDILILLHSFPLPPHKFSSSLLNFLSGKVVVLRWVYNAKNK